MNDLFSALYELFGYIQDFSDNLYETGVNIPVGIVMVLLSAVGMASYYFAINHPKFNRWFHWLLVVGVLALINFGIAWAMSDSALYDYFQGVNQEIPYSTIDFVTYSVVNAVWSVVFSFIFSLCMKWGSSNAKYSPF
jgi:hypothetical protein